MRDYIYCPSTGTKHFSNKYYPIRIKFHEHNMAVADFKIEYCWWEDEFPQMRICVSDEDGQIYTMNRL